MGKAADRGFEPADEPLELPADPPFQPADEVLVPNDEGPLSYREATALANRAIRWWHDLPAAQKADVVLAGYKASVGADKTTVAMAGVDTEALRGAVQRDALAR